jgi:hypothetical protein
MALLNGSSVHVNSDAGLLSSDMPYVLPWVFLYDSLGRPQLTELGATELFIAVECCLQLQAWRGSCWHDRCFKHWLAKVEIVQHQPLSIASVKKMSQAYAS